MLDFFLLSLTRTRESLFILRVYAHLAIRARRIALGEIRRVDRYHGIDDLGAGSVQISGVDTARDAYLCKVLQSGRQDQNVGSHIEFE